MEIDADGLERVDLEWTIEGTKARGTRSGKLYGLHEQEVMFAKDAIKRHGRRGDTITIKAI